MRPLALPFAALAALLLTACEAEEGSVENAAEEGFDAQTEPADAAVPGSTDETAAYDGIAADEVVHFTGTEPFWAGEVDGGTLTYKTPEDQDGAEIAVERFAGRGGISFAGKLEDANFEMTVTPLECSDGMSDRTYPFTVTLKIGEETRNGCGWTEKTPFTGPEHP